MRTRVTAHHTAYKTKDHLKDLLKGIGVKGARLLQEEAVDGQPAATGLKGGPHQAARAVDVERTAGGHRLGHQQAQAGRVRLRVVGAVPRVLQRFHCHHRHAAVSGHASFSHTVQITHTQIRIRIHRIHVFLGLQDPDPDPLVRGMDPDPALDPDPDPSITMQK
jgi:hypothetical protein